MQYVFQTELEYRQANDVLGSLRNVVKDLKQTHPELNECSLADVGFTRKKDRVDVTLYFQESD